jgi:hypothetical protein
MSTSRHAANTSMQVSKIKLGLCIIGLIICLILLLLTPPLSQNDIARTKPALPAQKLPELSIGAQTAAADVVQPGQLTKTDNTRAGHATTCPSDELDHDCAHLMCPQAIDGCQTPPYTEEY